MKKTLLISPYAPPSAAGSGLMIYNLWSFFPPGQMAVLTAEKNIDPKIGQYQLDCPYYYYGNQTLSLNFNDGRGGLLPKVKRWLKNLAPVSFLAQLVLLAYLPGRIVRAGKQAVQHERIELLFGYSDFGPNLLACYLLHRATKKPLYLHFFDMYQGNKMPLVFRPLAGWLEPKLFRDAEKIFVMCEKLQEHYQNKYGRKIFVIHNSIIFNLDQAPALRPAAAARPYRIIYLGSLYWAQQQAVMNIIEAVKRLSAHEDVELILYTPHTADYLRSVGIHETRVIKFASCPPEQVQQVMNRADLVVLGLAFNTKYPELINTSSPGRLCDYLLCGAPILVHAPKESFLSQYAQKENFAYVADVNSPEAVLQGVQAIKNNANLAGEYIANAGRLARQNHNAKLTAALLMQEL